MVNTRDGNSSANLMQQEQAGPLEGYAPETRAYCSVSWSTLAELFVGKRDTMSRGLHYGRIQPWRWAGSVTILSWKIFVGNRVTEIHTYTTPSEWKYCPGEDNPADYLSRGLTLRNWNSCEHGGTVLRGCHKTRIIGHANQPENINHCQMRKQFLLVGSTHNSNRLIESSRFSSY